MTRGHFLSPASEDAVLWIDGCEPHAFNFGGTVLLTRTSRRWTMLWYQAGVRTEQCHKVALPDAREILVCMARYGWMLGSSTNLYVVDLLDPDRRERTFFAAPDNTGGCGWTPQHEKEPSPLVLSHIDRVEFVAGKAADVPAVSVTASFGLQPIKPEDVKVCQSNPGAFLPPTKAYRMEFLFDGSSYQPSPATATAAADLPGAVRAVMYYGKEGAWLILNSSPLSL
jgi:hypothetical protein